MNIYQMYEINNNEAGFWVIRDSWGKTVAKVTMIGKQTSGKLKGRPPYYNNPTVFCELYDLDTGNIIQNKLEYYQKDGRTTISSPGTYTYNMVDTDKIKSRFGWNPEEK